MSTGWTPYKYGFCSQGFAYLYRRDVMEPEGIKVEGVAPLLDLLGLPTSGGGWVTKDGVTMLASRSMRGPHGSVYRVMVPRQNLCPPGTPGVPDLMPRDLGLTDPRSLVRPLHHATWPGMTPRAINKVREKLGQHRGRGR